MGERYKARLQEILEELGPTQLRVYLNPEGVSPAYRDHVMETFRSLNVELSETREHANFVFDGHCRFSRTEGQVVAFFREDELVVEGALAS